MTRSIAHLCNETATTTRPSAAGTGLVAWLSDVGCTPAYPISPELAQSMLLRSPRESKVIYSYPQAHSKGTATVNEMPDIREEDRITVSGATYVVRAAGEWPDDLIPTLELYVEQVKT